MYLIETLPCPVKSVKNFVMHNAMKRIFQLLLTYKWSPYLVKITIEFCHSKVQFINLAIGTILNLPRAWESYTYTVFMKSVCLEQSYFTKCLFRFIIVI